MPNFPTPKLFFLLFMSDSPKFADLIGEVIPLKRKPQHPDFSPHAPNHANSTDNNSIKHQKSKHKPHALHALKPKCARRYDSAHQRPKHHAPIQPRLRLNLDNISPLRFNALCAGELPITRTLDLHGLSVSQALNYVADALSARRNRYPSCWLVIHGKGKHSASYDRSPIRHNIIELLSTHPAVAAIASVMDAQQESGALWIDLHPITDLHHRSSFNPKR